MELAHGIHMIAGTIGNRPLQLSLLRGADRTVLLDSGTAQDPEALLVPWLRDQGMQLSEIDLVINTHSDLDHCGGNHALKQLHPEVLLTCGEADRLLVEDPAMMWRVRYNAYERDHGIFYVEPGRTAMLRQMGHPQPVDFTWRGGETLRLGPDWVVEIHAVPGHSPGHLAVFDPRSGTLLSGDAIHGAVYLSTDGVPALCPTYADVDAYLSTIAYIESLPVTSLASCHWPIHKGDAVAAFCEESRGFVDTAERALIRALGESATPLTLRKIIDILGPQLGEWPREADIELAYALSGHIDRLLRLHVIVQANREAPYSYKLVQK